MIKVTLPHYLYDMIINLMEIGIIATKKTLFNRVAGIYTLHVRSIKVYGSHISGLTAVAGCLRPGFWLEKYRNCNISKL